MRVVSMGSSWILGCAAFGLFALCATPAVAAPNDPGARPAPRERRVGLVNRAILRLPMVDDFRTDRSSFLPAEQEIAFEDLGKPGGHEARGRHPARDSRRERRDRYEGMDEVDLLTLKRAGGSEGGSVSTPIPEPSSFLLLAAGAGLVAYAAKRKFA